MSAGTTDIWESHDANPMLWLAMSALALVAHLTVLQAGIAAYQAQVSVSADPTPETRIFASALQVAGVESPQQTQLQAVQVTPTAPTQTQSLRPSQPVAQTLSATTSATPVAQTVDALVPAATPNPVSTAPTLSASVAKIAPLSPTPEKPTLTQPGVAPVATTPIRSAPVAPTDVVDSRDTVEVAVIDAPAVTGTEPLPEPAPVALAEPAPLPDLANSLPPQPGTVTEDQPGVASPNASDQTTEEAQETYNTVLDFLRGFDGGPCFAALPVLAEDGAFRFETFANSPADLTRFRQALEIKTGTLPGTVMKPVSDAQCQALPFVTAAARYPEFQLYFDLAARDIPSGDRLSGKLGNTSGGFVSLLLIDDEGVVQDLGSFLKFRAGYAGFNIPMTLKGSPVETQQLLMALSTRARLKTLQSLSGQPAKDFFQRLAVEVLQQGGGEDVALVAFSVR